NAVGMRVNCFDPRQSLLMDSIPKLGRIFQILFTVFGHNGVPLQIPIYAFSHPASIFVIKSELPPFLGLALTSKIFFMGKPLSHKS
ncbi:MAG: hypothetical protein IJ694_01745, partial [Acidaminococcaceae bacterium]|nr:hypothetical protein [Acidaminococcaceae bacterium]